MDKSRNYKNYIFDLYGTPVDIHTDEEQELLWEKLALFYGVRTRKVREILLGKKEE